MKYILILMLALPVYAVISYSPSSDGGLTCSGHPCTASVTCAGATCAATDVQTALDATWLGDTVSIQAGKVWTTTGLVLHPKSSGSGVLTVRTSTVDSLLPVSTARITPIYKALLPQLQLTSSSGNPLISVEQGITPVIGVTFMGIWFSTAPGVNNDYLRMINTWVVSGANATGVTGVGIVGSTVTLTANTAGYSNGDHIILTCGQKDSEGACGLSGVTGWWSITNVTGTTLDLVGPTTPSGVYTSGLAFIHNIQYQASMTADNITIDRCLVLPDSMSQVKNGVTIGGRTHTIINSYFDQLKADNDSQAISMPNAVGPVLIDNNYIGGGSGENVISGGAVATVPNLVATDVTVTNNTIYKDAALYEIQAWAANSVVRAGKLITNGMIASTGGITGNVLPTFPVSVCPAAPVCNGSCCVTDGTVVWQKNFLTSGADHWTVKNLFELKGGLRVTVRWNMLDSSWADGQTGNAIILAASKQVNIGIPQLSFIEFGNNVIRNVVSQGSIIARQDIGDGVANDVNVHDNLFYNFTGGWDGFIMSGRTSASPPYFTNLVFNHNTIEKPGNGNQFNFSDGPGRYDGPVWTNNIFRMDGMLYPIIIQGTCFGIDITALNCITQGRTAYTFSKNILSLENLGNWPSGNYNPSWGNVGFTNVALADYSLLPSSTYHNVGTDGKDLGIDASQSPQIKKLNITPASTTVMLDWSVSTPAQNIPCVIEVGPNAAFESYVSDLNVTSYIRPDVALGTGTLSRSIIVGKNSPLSSSTSYAYRLHCGGAVAYGNFITNAPGVLFNYYNGGTFTSGTFK